MSKDLNENLAYVHQSGMKVENGGSPRLSLLDADRQFYRSAPFGYFILDTDYSILDVNTSGARLLGTEPEKILGKKLTSFIAHYLEDEFICCMHNIQTSQQWQECEMELAKTDGSKFYAMIQGRQIADNREFMLLLSDITERKRAETSLKESERKHRELADLLAEGIFECDLNGTVTYANRKGLISLGLTEDDLKNGIKVFDVIAPENVALAMERFSKVLSQVDIGAGEYLLRRRDGTTFPALVHSLAIIQDGIVVGVRGLLVDITERKQAENALIESERKYRELADLLDEGVFEADLGGTVTYANRKALVSLGLSESDLKSGFKVFDVIVAQDLDEAHKRFRKVLNQENIGPVEYLVKRTDGSTFPALTHSSAIVREGAVIGVRGVLIDISDLKRAQRALKESEERFRTLLKSLHEGIWVLDKDNRTTFVNPRMAEMLGYTEEEMLMKPVYAFSDPEWQQKTTVYMNRRKQGISEQVEGELLRKDGEQIYALLETSPILDELGNYIGSVAGVQDITERKHNEERLRQMMLELDRSNKELEQFAYVTSHDLREPLRMMTSFAQSLEKRYKHKLDNTADEYIHFIVDGANRMQRLIDDILIYSRVTTRALPFEAVDMEVILQEILLNLKASIDETGASIKHDSLPIIQADPTQMKQVLQNLISNALKFHKEGLTPIVYVSARKDQNQWLFTVRDNGIGIDPELFGKLFNLFQRLHPADKYPGTGVGLAVAKKIVQRHGGQIWVESQPGQGTTFNFTVPI